MKHRIYYQEIVVRTDHEPEIQRARKAGRKVEKVTYTREDIEQANELERGGVEVLLE